MSNENCACCACALALLEKFTADMRAALHGPAPGLVAASSKAPVHVLAHAPVAGAAPPPAAPSASGFCVPGGRERNRPIEHASDEALAFWSDRIRQNLASGATKPKFREQDEALLLALDAEIAARAGGPSAAQARGSFDDLP